MVLTPEHCDAVPWFLYAVVFAMKTSTILAFVGAVIYSHAAVHFSFNYKQQKPTAAVIKPSRGAHRRSTIADLVSKGATCAVDVTVGTPGQVVSSWLSKTG